MLILDPWTMFWLMASFFEREPETRPPKTKQEPKVRLPTSQKTDGEAAPLRYPKLRR